jgi:hypothetical protein
MTSANPNVRDSDGSPAGPFAVGSGEVNPGKVAAPGSAFNPGLVYDAGFDDYLGFLCEAGPDLFRDPAQTCGDLANASTPTDAADLNYPSIGMAAVPGTKTVTRRVTSVVDHTVVWRPHVTAPAGYRVVVAPEVLRLAPGETASYTVTVTNDAAPVDQWEFGSITWRGGGFSARSPIAVQGVALRVPAAVKGSGTTGQLGIPVQFGYTGAYAAVPHGLVAPTVSSGSVGQDPDQTFPSKDDDQGGVVKIPVTLTGVEAARWVLPVPAEVDLDLYLLGPDGSIVAQSTSGSGETESIDLARPPDGTYTVVIHGWKVAQAPLPFELSQWLVPVATGGSLAVTAAPSAATNATSASVTVAWSGLDAGTTYLGAVSHEQDTTTLGLTLVTVTT